MKEPRSKKKRSTEQQTASMKNYKVIVTYVELPEEEARIKKAALEHILKKAFLNP